MAKVTEAKVAEFTPDEKNANKGTERGRYLLETSIERVGAGRGIVVDKHGRVIAGNKTQEVAIAKGIEDAIVVETDGTQLVVTKRTDFDLSDPDPNNPARQYAYLDNRSSEVGLEWDAAQIQVDLEEGFDFSTMFRDFELELITNPPPEFSDDLLDVPKDAKPNPRNLPIDVIFTLSNYMDAYVPMALTSGLLWGTQSSTRCLNEQFAPPYTLSFVDNDYFHYDHNAHLETIKRFRPKYATTRDFMSKAQCEAGQITFYELQQVLDWAEELEQYAENVIVIPKVDVLDKIPEKYILGYSVPTSHGGTPLPVEAFKGRRVHLLGGSWKAQLAHMAQLGDDVVSLDNNHCNLIADWAHFYLLDGEEIELIDLNPVFRRYPNNRTIALGLSFGAMAAKVNELYRKEPDGV